MKSHKHTLRLALIGCTPTKFVLLAQPIARVVARIFWIAGSGHRLCLFHTSFSDSFR